MNIKFVHTIPYLQYVLLQADSEGNIIATEAIKLMKSVIPFTDEKFWTAVERICTKGNCVLKEESTYPAKVSLIESRQKF